MHVRRTVVTRKGKEGASALGLALKGLAVTFMVATPLFGVWLASSLAAYANRAVWLPVACGALLFPGLPLAWDGLSELRRRKHPKKRRFLTFFDRLVLRTLSLNLLFVVALLSLFPERAFLALSTRGDWALDGRTGPTANGARRVLLRLAGGVEWIYRSARDNPYRRGETPTPKPTPNDHPLPRPTAAPTGSSASSSSTSGTAPTGAASTAPPGPAPSPGGGPPPYPMTTTLHPVVAQMPREAETSIEAVGRYIREREPDPVLRVKALHDWVTDRVAYDVAALRAPRIPYEAGDARAVFQSRKGVCAGYAHLLSELGKVTGDEIVYVVGDARSSDAPLAGEPHAWNAVKLHGAWYLLDATWDAGSVSDEFKKGYSTDYLFTPPDLFARTHFPDHAEWLLMTQPISRAEFFRRPVLAPRFFSHHLTLRAPDRAQIDAEGPVEIQLDNPERVFVMVDFAPHGRTERTNCAGDGHTRATCTFPGAGQYDVRLYLNREQYGRYQFGGSVQVNARR